MNVFSNIKSSKSFTSLKAYSELYPVIIECLKFLNDQNTKKSIFKNY
jgi:hypothetical protein